MNTANHNLDHTPGPGQQFWEEKWQSHTTGWDIGHASPPIVQYFRQYPNKNAAVLIPGCGNAYEAVSLAERGFTNITLLDIAPKAVDLLRERFKGCHAVTILCEDFFRHQGSYDIIIEQAFFCAIPPRKRPDYVAQCHSLLRHKGNITGLLFDRTFDRQGPPFGGSETEYRTLFSPCFDIKTMAECYNSIAPRAGSELFIDLVKK
ncbi:MAG TPA: methyltransferase domain-containing protein [Edaphocola sp.]|nr:methyltransferase domain-containing protein [Edaphocola sp.]